MTESITKLKLLYIYAVRPLAKKPLQWHCRDIYIPVFIIVDAEPEGNYSIVLRSVYYLLGVRCVLISIMLCINVYFLRFIIHEIQNSSQIAISNIFVNIVELESILNNVQLTIIRKRTSISCYQIRKWQFTLHLILSLHIDFD